MDEFGNLIPGIYTIEFMNGEIREVAVHGNIIDSNAHPIYLVDIDNRMFNWMNILSILKVN